MTVTSNDILGSPLRSKILRTVFGSFTTAGVVDLLIREPIGFALDFVANTFQMRLASGSEALMGIGSSSEEASGLALDFTDNSYVVVVV